MKCHCSQVRYNDLSPMENHHAAAAFAILLEEGNNFLSEQPRKVSPPIYTIVWSSDWSRSPI